MPSYSLCFREPGVNGHCAKCHKRLQDGGREPHLALEHEAMIRDGYANVPPLRSPPLLI